MTEKNKMYLSPEIEEVEMENESVLCQSGGIDSLQDDNVYYDDLF